MKKIQEKNTLTKIGVFAASLVAATSAIYLYSPVIKTHADDRKSAEVNLRVTEVMSLVLDKNSLNLSLDPGSFASGVINATASTNSHYGYTLAVEDADGNSDLIHNNSNIDRVITSEFLGPLTSSEMEENTWGFSLNNTDFYGMPVNGHPVAVRRNLEKMETGSETTPINFGVKVGNIMSGTYSDKVLFTMYVNGQNGKPYNPIDPDNPPADPLDPGETVSYDPTTMQGFSCSSIEVGETATLTDVRDGKEYIVKKFWDGKCWTGENLKLGGAEPINLTSDDTDIPSGSFVLPAALSSTGSFPYEADTAAVYVNATYGGRYNWYAATAGTGNSSTPLQTDAAGSICPKGWGLPAGGEQTDNEIVALYRTYLADNPGSTYSNFYSEFVLKTSSSDYNKWWSRTNSEYSDSVYYAWYYRGVLASTSGMTAAVGIRCVSK